MKKLSNINEGILKRISHEEIYNKVREEDGISVTVNGKHLKFLYDDFEFLKNAIPLYGDDYFIEKDIPILGGKVSMCCCVRKFDGKETKDYYYITYESVKKDNFYVNDILTMWISSNTGNFDDNLKYINMINDNCNDETKCSFKSYVGIIRLDDRVSVNSDGYTFDIYDKSELNNVIQNCLNDRLSEIIDNDGLIYMSDVNEYVEEYGDDWIDFGSLGCDLEEYSYNHDFLERENYSINKLKKIMVDKHGRGYWLSNYGDKKEYMVDGKYIYIIG